MTGQDGYPWFHPPDTMQHALCIILCMDPGDILDFQEKFPEVVKEPESLDDEYLRNLVMI